MLKIENLKIKNIENDIVLVEDVSLSVNQGEIVLLEGVNGSGKSTILNAIMHHPDLQILSGKIILNNEDITNKNATELSRLNIFYAMQHSPEIEGVTNIKMLHKAYKYIHQNDIDYKDINISEFKNNLENDCDKFGLDKSLIMRDINLGFSGGQKKQADLINILALKPKVILLDEPDSGVDKEAVIKTYEIIKYFKTLGAIILLTSHNEKIKDIQIDRIYKIENKIIKEV